MIKKISAIVLFIFVCQLSVASTSVPLLDAKVNLKDKESLQRGAKWYMNYCLGCHSLKYQRYERTAKDIGVTYYTGQVFEKMFKENLIFTDSKIGDLIENALSVKDGKNWFGIAPPDLTLETRVRGADWVYTYLLSFYQDPKAQWGTNNTVYPDVAMPNVLINLEGKKIPIKAKSSEKIDHLQLTEKGSLTEQEFEQVVHDIVNFLAYVADPVKTKREFLGILVLAFLAVLIGLTYALKKEYWKDVH